MKIKVTRRGFLKAVSSVLLLSSIDWSRAVNTFAEAVRGGSVNILWFEAQSCTGDTTSLLEATDPSILDVVSGKFHFIGPGSINLRYSDTLMLSWGEEALKVLHDAESGRLSPFILVIEGGIPIDEELGGPSGSDYFCYIGEENGKPITCVSWLRRLLDKAMAVVAVGTCACYGGLIANTVLDAGSSELESMIRSWAENGWSKSPTGTIGFFDDPVRGTKGLVSRVPEATPYKAFLEMGCKSPGAGGCKPAIAVPGCPANGNAVLRVLANVYLWYKGVLPLPELDAYWRPVFIYGPTVHDQCPRAGSYAAGDLRVNPGDPDHKCLFAVGCKGPVSHCPWNKYGWVNGVGGPTRTGGICIGCTNPGFTEKLEPLYKPLPAPEPLKPKYALAGLAGGLITGSLAALGLSMLRKRSIEACIQEYESVVKAEEGEESERGKEE